MKTQPQDMLFTRMDVRCAAHVSLALVAAILFNSAPVHAAAGGFMSASQIRSKIIGRTFQFKGPMASGVTTYRRNGTFSVKIKQWGDDDGPWWFKGNQWCRTLKRFKRTNCLTFKSLGGGKYKASNGVVISPR